MASVYISPSSRHSKVKASRQQMGLSPSLHKFIFFFFKKLNIMWLHGVRGNTLYSEQQSCSYGDPKILHRGFSAYQAGWAWLNNRQSIMDEKLTKFSVYLPLLLHLSPSLFFFPLPAPLSPHFLRAPLSLWHRVAALRHMFWKKTTTAILPWAS